LRRLPSTDDSARVPKHDLTWLTQHDIHITHISEARGEIGAIGPEAEHPLTAIAVSVVLGRKHVDALSSADGRTLQRRRCEVQRDGKGVQAPGAEYTENLPKTCSIVLDVLEYFGRRAQVEALVGIREALHVLASDAGALAASWHIREIFAGGQGPHARPQPAHQRASCRELVDIEVGEAIGGLEQDVHQRLRNRARTAVGAADGDFVPPETNLNLEATQRTGLDAQAELRGSGQGKRSQEGSEHRRDSNLAI